MRKKIWPYLAGMLDSDGCITSCTTKNPSGNVAYSLRVQITNVNRNLMRWLVQGFGGSYTSEIKGKNSFSTGSTIFTWRCPAENQEALFLGLFPHLVVKKNQALLGLDFRRTESLEEKHKISEQLWALNQRKVDIKIPEKFLKSPDAFRYVAGYIDGDGCISLADGQGNNPRISVASTDFIIIKWLLAHFGGKFYTKKQNDKLLYQWRVSGAANKLRFLLAVLPYLIIKRDKAKSGIAILRLRDKDPKGHSQVITEQIQQEVKTFNFAATTNMRDTREGEDRV